MSDTIYRQWLMLKSIPRHPQKVTAGVICDRLSDNGYQTSKRTIERDLTNLSTIFPLICDDRSKPYGWSWSRDSDLYDIAAMDPNTALTFTMAEQFLSNMLPPKSFEMLQGHFARARSSLDAINQKGFSAWADKVRILPRSQPLLPADIKEGITDVVYEALLHNKIFLAEYVRGDKVHKEFEVSPLGLVVRESVIYLIATLWDYDNIVQLPIHRFTSAELLEKTATTPNGFSLGEYVDSAELHMLDNHHKEIKFKAIFNHEAARHLYETPLSHDQKLKPLSNGDTEVTATLKNTKQLRWWILGFGEKVEVLSPKSLRNEIAHTAQQLSKLYMQP